jgi:hypothetical protein
MAVMRRRSGTATPPTVLAIFDLTKSSTTL